MAQTAIYYLPISFDTLCPVVSGSSDVYYCVEADINISSPAALAKALQFWYISADQYGQNYEPPNNLHLLFQSIIHELGHAAGLKHNSNPNSVMFPTQNSEAVYLKDPPLNDSFFPTTLNGAQSIILASESNDPNLIPDCKLNKLSIPILKRVGNFNNSCSSRTIGISEVQSSGFEIKLFPNPIYVENLEVDMHVAAGDEIQGEIINSLGEVVLSFNSFKSNSSILKQSYNVSGLSPGVYFYLASINKIVNAVKFVKM